MVLDSTTGDFYSFDFKADLWVAEGNVGIQKIGAGIGGVAAAILADASAITKGHSSAKKVCRRLVITFFQPHIPDSYSWTILRFSIVVAHPLFRVALGLKEHVV